MATSSLATFTVAQLGVAVVVPSALARRSLVRSSPLLFALSTMQCASPILEAAESLFWPKPAPQEEAPAPNLAVLLSERDADVPTVRKALAAGSRVGDCLPGPSGSSGFTALHVAAYRDNEDVVRYLALRGGRRRAARGSARRPRCRGMRRREAL